MFEDRRSSLLVSILFTVALLGPGAWAQAVPLIDQYGCFAQSGDGRDLLPDGKPAAIIPAGSLPWSSPQPCGLQWIADNSEGLAPNPPPSTIHFTRSFRLSKDLVGHGTFILRFKADDKAEFFLNDQSVAVASCSPPPGNDGECQQYCHEVVIDGSKFLPDPQVNQLKADLTNLFNVPVKDKFGWTNLSYSLCVQSGPYTPASAVTQKTSDRMDMFNKLKANRFWIYMAGFLVLQVLFMVLRFLARRPGDPDRKF